MIVATFRRPERIKKLLAKLEVQDFGLANFEVVVCDDCSGPAALAALEALLDASPLTTRLVVHDRNRGPGKARNTAIAAATAPLIACTDDDCEPEPDWLRAGVAALKPGVNVVVGKVAPNPAQSDQIGPWSRSVTVNDARYFQGANTFYAIDDVRAVGGFDDDFDRGGEDTDLGMRVLKLGRVATFAPEALVFHDVRAGSVIDLARENLWKWVDLPLVLRHHPEMRQWATHGRFFWKKSHPPTFGALLGLLLAVIGVFFTPWALVLLVLPLWWVRFRIWVEPRFGNKLYRLRTLPGVFVVDSSEVIAVIRGSFKHHTILI